MIQRAIQSRIEAAFFKEKAVIIYGARQVGKTTLVRAIQKKFPDMNFIFSLLLSPNYGRIIPSSSLTGCLKKECYSACIRKLCQSPMKPRCC